MILAPAEFEERTRPLIGLPVSLPWKGYGSAVFLELGDLGALESKRVHHNKGAACISVEWDWRVEAHNTVLYGSSNSRPSIEAGIQKLRGTVVEAIAVAGNVPELVVRFSNGHCLKSMVMVTGGPEWSIRTLDGQWIHARSGKLECGDDTSARPAHEETSFAMAERAAVRWGVPLSGPAAGQCAACASFIPLDGDGHFLDYGCCAAEDSPFDGRSVERTSGCPAFLAL